MTINPISAGPLDDRDWTSIEEIFFLSAGRRKFRDENEKSDFSEQWLRYYRNSEPDQVYVARDSKGTIKGYLTGCADSGSAEALFQDIPSYHLFEDQFTDYPAHFHINCHPDWRGRGIGTLLVQAFKERCADDGSAGVHIVTAASARNTVFYRRCGFSVEIRRKWQNSRLLFMAASFAPADRTATP